MKRNQFKLSFIEIILAILLSIELFRLIQELQSLLPVILFIIVGLLVGDALIE